MRISYDDLNRVHVRTIRDHRAGETVIYSVAHAAGAFANDSRVRKCRFFAGDVGGTTKTLGKIMPIVMGAMSFLAS